MPGGARFTTRSTAPTRSPRTAARTQGKGYNPVRGAKVIAWARELLDGIAPLASGSHMDAAGYPRRWRRTRRDHVTTARTTALKDPRQIRRLHAAMPQSPTRSLLVNNGLHAEIVIDRTPSHRQDRSGGRRRRRAWNPPLTTIMDCEDSVAAVDADDKVAGLPQLARPDAGRPRRELEKGGKTIDAQAQCRPRLHGADGGAAARCPAASLMLVRNVGHLMTTAAVLDSDGNEIREGMLDAAVTGADRACTISRANGAVHNSRTGSVYIVKPKMHGPEEVAFASRAVRPHRGQRSGLPPQHARRSGIMDEERRTTVNLKECIRAAERARRLHQHRLPRPHRRRDPHLDGSGPDDPQGRHEAARLDQGLRGLERRHRAWVRPAGPRPDRQGHVGDARPDGRHAGAEDRPSAGRRQHRLGAFAHRGDAARHPLSPGRCLRPCRPSLQTPHRARSCDDILDHPARRPAELDARRRSRASSTTTPRAFSAMSCAGSTRASAAPRCPTSTTSG